MVKLLRNTSIFYQLKWYIAFYISKQIFKIEIIKIEKIWNKLWLKFLCFLIKNIKMSNNIMVSTQ